MSRVIFILGKGGSGKTTTSVTLAREFAEAGYRTEIISLDPAHNLGGVIGMPLGDAPQKISENILGREINLEQRISNSLLELMGEMKKKYRYLSTIHFDSIFQLFKKSPGNEETVLAETLYEILLESKTNTDYSILDMPPTGMALRILGLPGSLAQWSVLLHGMRREMDSKKKVIERIHKTESKEDELLQNLGTQTNKWKNLEKAIQGAWFHGMLTGDDLSLDELKTIRSELAENGMSLRSASLNCVHCSSTNPAETAQRLQKEFSIPIFFPKKKEETGGLSAAILSPPA